MPLQQIIDVEWLNSNALRAYPLSDEVTEIDVSGGVRLPRDLLVDFSMPYDAAMGIDTSLFYVSNVTIYSGGIVLTVSHSVVGEVGNAVVTRSSHTQNRTYFLQGQGDFDGMVGKVTIGNIENTLALGGSFDFELTATRILPQLFYPDIPGVSALRISAGVGGASEDVWGVVTLDAGRNFRIRVEDTDPINHPGDPAHQTIILDALKREDLNEECGCDGEVTKPPPIRTINGVSPQADGSFFLLGDACIKFESAGAGLLEVADECSEPCCTSEGLQVIEGDLNGLSLDVRTQRAFMDRIEAHLVSLDGMRQVLQQLLNTTCP